MTDFDALLGSWQAFFSAQLAAGAALVGLLFVSLSLNLARILANASLPKRAEVALLLLMLQLVVASVALIPDQGPKLLGAEVVAVASTVWIATLLHALSFLRAMPPELRRLGWQSIALLQVAVLPYIAGGAMLLAGAPRALHLLALGMIVSIVKAGIDAWVLLVEINR